MLPSHSEADAIANEIRAGWAAARMAADKFDQIERALMNQQAEKRTVEEIVEANTGGIESMASWIHGLQIDACNFVDQWRNQNKAGSPIDWDVVDYHEIPRDFVELLERVAKYEVRL